MYTMKQKLLKRWNTRKQNIFEAAVKNKAVRKIQVIVILTNKTTR